MSRGAAAGVPALGASGPLAQAAKRTAEARRILLNWGIRVCFLLEIGD
jgi:hypothetical protein